MKENFSSPELPEPSLDKLFRDHWNEVYQFAFNKTGDPEDAKDLTCETFIKAFLKYESFDKSRRFSPWIKTICRNIYIDNYRKNKKIKTSSEDSMLNSISDNDASPENRMIINEEYSEFLKQLNFLNEEHQQIISLYYVEELSHKEISDKLDITEGNSRQRLWVARNNLINALRPPA